MSLGNETFLHQRDDVYRALGRYVVEFSRLIWWMRHELAAELSPGGGDVTTGEIVLGELTAYPIYAPFFAICAHKAELDETEKKIETKLFKAVDAEAKRRNALLHGDWLIGGSDGTMSEPALIRVKPRREEGTFVQEFYSAERLDGISDEVGRPAKHRR